MDVFFFSPCEKLSQGCGGVSHFDVLFSKRQKDKKLRIKDFCHKIQLTVLKSWIQKEPECENWPSQPLDMSFHITGFPTHVIQKVHISVFKTFFRVTALEQVIWPDYHRIASSDLFLNETYYLSMVPFDQYRTFLFSKF